jgi:cell division protein FtsI (penicillin-binding protein 3)
MTRRQHGTRPAAWRRRLLLTGWVVCAGAILARATQIQVFQADRWAVKATDQQRGTVQLPAPRGGIYDRWGTPLAVTRERVRVSIAGDQVRDPEALSDHLVDALGITRRSAMRFASSGAWREIDLFPVAVREELEGTRGVYLESVFERYRPHRDLARGIVGVEIDEAGRGGVEQSFDEILRGEAGSQIVARDHLGRPIPGDEVIVQAPRSGGEVVTTIDTNLQEIAQGALLDAIEEHEALGGDILITNPYTGEILALFSTQNGHTGALSAVNSSFEPGSTIKPFIAAGLIHNDLATMRDSVDVGNGRWEVEGRTLTDTHTEGWLSLRVALRESSNVGMAMLAQRMEPGVQYETLRDFGFGSLTGVGLPGEIAGTLRRPDSWSRQSRASLAIGYELAVTPLQMAMAYGALANGGVLMQPQLIKEVRASDGSVVETFEPQPIRRVVGEDVARSIGSALEEVVTEGTGSLAQLGSIRVAGKSGTARFSSNGGYVPGEYSSSFVGYFPADDPQLVVFVKLDRPQSGDYYGGAVAAPVTRATMEAALAAAPPSIDLRGVAEEPRRSAFRWPVFSASDAPDIALPPVPEAWSEGERPQDGPDGRIAVPDLAGRPAREAIRNLHRFGFRVSHVGSGQVERTIPAAGTRVMPGDTIRLRFRGEAHE